ncbi:MAG: hypothetical protein R2862_04995 [Thermoanaerobaculia bacterium]
MVLLLCRRPTESNRVSSTFVQLRAHPYTRALWATLPIPGRGAPGEPLAAIPGQIPTPATLPHGCLFHPRCPERIERRAQLRPDWTATAGSGIPLRPHGCGGGVGDVTALLAARALSKEYPSRTGRRGPSESWPSTGWTSRSAPARRSPSSASREREDDTACMLARRSSPPPVDPVRRHRPSRPPWPGAPLRTPAAAIDLPDPLAALDPRMRIGDSVAEPPLVIHRLARPGDRRSAGLLAEVGLDSELTGRMPHEPRVDSCSDRSPAMTDPQELLIADEPVWLDPSVRAQIVHLLAERRRARGLGVLFVAHDLALVERISERSSSCSGAGRRKRMTAPILHSPPASIYSAMLRAATPGSGHRPAQSGCLPAPADDPPAGRRTVAPSGFRCPVARERCRVEARSEFILWPAGAVASSLSGRRSPAPAKIQEYGSSRRRRRGEDNYGNGEDTLHELTSLRTDSWLVC